MARTWTREKVLELAPDAGSARAGEGLGSARKWASLGRSERALWGEIQGSGKDPYRTRVDLTEPAFKCSCPSRKFPCKHGLGLLLVLAGDPGAVAEGKPPAWVAEWLADRDARQQKRVEKEEAVTAEPVDPVAQAKRVQRREEKIAAGLEELALWMADLVRQGLAAAQARPAGFWDNMAARLVDAQAPGLARQVRNLSAVVFSGDGWQARLLAGLGRLYLLVHAYGRLATLPPELAADVRTYAGWTRSQEELTALPGVRDTWWVVGRRVTREDQLRVQRTWLWGKSSNAPALLLDFAVGNQSLDTTYQVGSGLEAELVYYPSAQPLRAVLRGDARSLAVFEELPGCIDISAALQAYARALSCDPWLERWPMGLRHVTPVTVLQAGEARIWKLQDAEGRQVPMNTDEEVGWSLVGISGGRPLDVFGEWDGEGLMVLSASQGRRVLAVMQRDAGAGSLVRAN